MQRIFRMFTLGWLLTLAAGSEATMNTAEVVEYRLANGLRVLIKEVHAAPVVSVFVWYGVGSRNEPGGQSGLAHFLEHMLFKGTRQFPKGEIARLIGRTGGEQNAFTSYDYTAYFETVSREHLELALRIESDRMTHALLEPAEMEKERTVILSELDGYRNHPSTRLRDLVNAQTWTEHPYRRPVIGWRSEVERLTAGQLRDFYRAHYRPDNATLVVVGDLDPAALRGQIERHFASIPSGPEVPATSWPAETQQGERRVVLRDRGQAPLVVLQVHVPPGKDPEHAGLTVLNDTLTNGRTSRLYRALVDSGLAAEVSGGLHEMIDPGVWSIRVVGQPRTDPQKIVEVMRREFDRLQKEPVQTRELQRSVNQVRAHLTYAKDSLTDQAMVLGFYQTVTGDWRLPDRFPDLVSQVTAGEVQRLAKHYLDPDRLTWGAFYPQAPGSAMPESVSALEPVSAFPPFFRAGGAGAPQAPLGAAGAAETACRRTVLPNGLVLLVQPNWANPTVHVAGLVKAGIVNEPESLPGLAHVHARMLERGTRRYSAQALAEALEFKGIELNYSPGQEELNFRGQALAADAELLLTALAETLRYPTFPRVELEKVRREVLTSCRLAQDNPAAQASQAFFALAYPEGHPMRRSLISAEPGLKRLGRSDLTSYHQQWVRPDQIILSVAGAVDPDSALRWVTEAFGTWRAEGSLPVLLLPPMQPPETARTAWVDMPGKPECITILGHDGLQRQDPDYYAAYVANHVLGGSGLSSRFMRTVRDELGLTYGIYSQFRPARGARPWLVNFQSSPEHVDQALAAARAEVKRLQQTELPAADLTDAQEELVGSLAISLETSSGLAAFNRDIEYNALGLDYLKRFPALIRGLSREQVQAAARRWLHPDLAWAATAGAKPAQPKLTGGK